MFRSTYFTYALRTLRRSPLFTTTVLATLALGIGSNAAIFSVVNALFLHPAGVSRPERLVAPRVSYQKHHLDRIDMSLPDFQDIRKSTQVFSAAAASNLVGLNFTSGNSPVRLQAATVTWQWFDVFGAKPLLGRGFHQDDDQPGSSNVAVLSFDIWRRMFGAERSAVGNTIELDRKPYRIIGVMPANFRWPSQADLWVPLGLSPRAYAEDHRFDEFYPVVARLRKGVSVEQCKRFVDVLTSRVKDGNKELAAYARDSQWSMEVETFSELTSGDLKSPL
ncbi:MAG: ABC transporter permease, partial [Acidobacteriaceae bacterium]|nr:ABC transporter permease [Acidobacteriaceae bacterium]